MTSSAALSPALRRAALVVWEYHRLGQEPSPAELIFALGSHDLRVAERAAQLYLAGLAPWVVMSGGLGNLTAKLWTVPEADQFAAIARRMGVPSEAILVENQSTNTGENVQFTRRLLAARGLSVRTVLAVQKPYMERRALATLRQQWPEVEVTVTSPQLDFDTYCAGAISPEQVISIMVGDLHRIMEYPKRGFMAPQAVPDKVMAAFEALVRAGFRQHLLPPALPERD